MKLIYRAIAVGLALSLASSIVYAQVPKKIDEPATMPLGMSAKGQYGISAQTDIDRLMLTVDGIGSSSRDALYEKTLKSYMMPPRKVNANNGSVMYALAAALEYYINLDENYKDNLSPDYIRLSLGGAPSTEEAFAFLVEKGTISAAIMPYETASLPPSVYAAKHYRIKNFMRLMQPSTHPKQKIFELKKAITRGNPVIVEIKISQGFKALKSRMWDLNADKSFIGSHFVVVVGYDEERKAVEILNCWGRDWGNGGYAWLSYDDFTEMAQHGFVLLP
jgi:hypothetical protein